MVIEPLSPDVILSEASGLGRIRPLDEMPFGRGKGTCDTDGRLSDRQRRPGQAPDGEPRTGRMGIGPGNLRALAQPGEDGVKDDRQDRASCDRGAGLRYREFLQDIRRRTGRGGNALRRSCGQAEDERGQRPSVHGCPARQTEGIN